MGPFNKLADGWRIPMLWFFHRAQILFHLPSAQLRVIQMKQMDVFKVLYHRWTQLKADCYLLRVAGWRRRPCRGNRFGFGLFFFAEFGERGVLFESNAYLIFGPQFNDLAITKMLHLSLKYAFLEAKKKNPRCIRASLKPGRFFFFLSIPNTAHQVGAAYATPPASRLRLPSFPLQPRLFDSLHNYPPPLLMISSCFPAASAAVTFTAAGTGGFEIHSDAAALRTSRPRLA